MHRLCFPIRTGLELWFASGREFPPIKYSHIPLLVVHISSLLLHCWEPGDKFSDQGIYLLVVWFTWVSHSLHVDPVSVILLMTSLYIPIHILKAYGPDCHNAEKINQFHSPVAL
ncbi:hypothetical protein ACJX0J_034123, partial [Zea mays]